MPAIPIGPSRPRLGRKPWRPMLPHPLVKGALPPARAPAEEPHQVPWLDACGIEADGRAVGQKIRAKTQEVGVVGLVVPVFRDFPNLVERGGIHAA